MKNRKNVLMIRQFGIIAVIAIIGFAIGILSFTGCKNGTTFVRQSGGGNGGSGGDSGGGNGNGTPQDNNDAVGGTIVSDANGLSGTWVSELPVAEEDEEYFPKILEFGQAEICVPFYNDQDDYYNKTEFTPFTALYPSSGDGVRVALENRKFVWTLPNREPASAYLKSRSEVFPGITGGTFTGKVCWIREFTTSQKILFDGINNAHIDARWDYSIPNVIDKSIGWVEYEHKATGNLVYATAAGTVTGTKTFTIQPFYEHPEHDYDATYHFNLNLSKGWNTVIETRNADDSLTVTAGTPPKEMKWWLSAGW